MGKFRWLGWTVSRCWAWPGLLALLWASQGFGKEPVRRWPPTRGPGRLSFPQWLVSAAWAQLWARGAMEQPGGEEAGCGGTWWLLRAAQPQMVQMRLCPASREGERVLQSGPQGSAGRDGGFWGGGVAQGSRWGLVFCYFSEKGRSGQTPRGSRQDRTVGTVAGRRGAEGGVPGWRRSPEGWPLGTGAGGLQAQRQRPHCPPGAGLPAPRASVRPSSFVCTAGSGADGSPRRVLCARPAAQAAPGAAVLAPFRVWTGILAGWGGGQQLHPDASRRLPGGASGREQRAGPRRAGRCAGGECGAQLAPASGPGDPLTCLFSVVESPRDAEEGVGR